MRSNSDFASGDQSRFVVVLMVRSAFLPYSGLLETQSLYQRLRASTTQRTTPTQRARGLSLVTSAEDKVRSTPIVCLYSLVETIWQALYMTSRSH